MQTQMKESQSQAGFRSEMRPLPPELSSPILVSERLVLRAPEMADTNAISHLANNMNVAAMVSRMPHPYTTKDAENFVARVSSGAMGKCVYAVTFGETKQFVGACGLESHETGRGLELGYWIGEPYWRQGLATEAAHALVDLAFRKTDVNALHAACRVINPASRRVIHKCGFQYAGQGMLTSIVAGKVPVERYRLDRRTWVSLRTWRAL